MTFTQMVLAAEKKGYVLENLTADGHWIVTHKSNISRIPATKINDYLMGIISNKVTIANIGLKAAKKMADALEKELRSQHRLPKNFIVRGKIFLIKWLRENAPVIEMEYRD